MSLTILTRSPFRKLHRAAFSGDAVCPSCYGSKVRLLERIAGYTYRWQCKACLQCFREDLTPAGHFGDQDVRTREVGPNPYRTFRGIDEKFRQDQQRRRLESLRKSTGFTPDMQIGVHRFKK